MNRRARMTDETVSATFTSLRGLLAPVEAPEEAPEQVVEMDLERIRPNPEQPRMSTSAAFAESSIEELAENIREHGLLQPIVVRPSGRFYQIVAGERRYRACALLGLERVPVRVVEPRDAQDELQIALAENLQRKALTPLEEARALRRLSNQWELSYRDLQRLTGKSVAHVHGRLQLLAYDDVRSAVEEKRIGVVDAIQLARVPDEAARRDLLTSVEEGALRGAALHRQVQAFLGELGPAPNEPEARELQTSPAPISLADARAVVEGLGEELSEDEREELTTLVSCAAEKLGLSVAAVPQTRPPEPLQDDEAAPVPAFAEPTTSDPAVEVLIVERTVTPVVVVSDPPPLPAQVGSPPAPPARETPPAPMSPESRRALSRAKEYRLERGYTLVNEIRVYWKNVERRGYAFTPGDWRAVPAGEGRFLITFGYRLDSEERSMEWWYGPDGTLEPANDEARQLTLG